MNSSQDVDEFYQDVFFTDKSMHVAFGIALGLLILLLFGVGFYCFLKRKRQEQDDNQGDQGEDDDNRLAERVYDNSIHRTGNPSPPSAAAAAVVGGGRVGNGVSTRLSPSIIWQDPRTVSSEQIRPPQQVRPLQRLLRERMPPPKPTVQFERRQQEVGDQ